MDLDGVTVEDLKELLGTIPEEDEEVEAEQEASEGQQGDKGKPGLPPPAAEPVFIPRSFSIRSLPDADPDFDSDEEEDEEDEYDEEEDEEETSEEEGESEEGESDLDAAELEAELDAEEAEEEYLARKQREEEELQITKQELINRYIRAKGVLKYEKKRNAYYQDRIYRASVRKGILIETELDKEEEKRNAKKHSRGRRHGRRHRSKRRKKAEAALENEEEASEKENADKEKPKAKDDKKKSKSIKDKIALQFTKEKKTKGFGEAFANEIKYQKLIRRIIKIQNNATDYLQVHKMNLRAHEEHRREWKTTHELNFQKLMEAIRDSSEFAVDSNTGHRIPKHLTEKYCQEMGKIHTKLCSTLIKMFKTRRGLELSEMRLNESEVEGEGLQMLEYEQLRVENQTLKDKLSDRRKDVDNIKDKISHAIQILAHFRVKMFHTTEMIREKQEELNAVNAEVYLSRERTEQANLRFAKLRKEEQCLVVDSGLLDNATLLRDYEKTHFEVVSLNEEKRKLTREFQNGTREIRDIRDKIDDMKAHFPELFANRLELEKKKKKRKLSYSYMSPYKRPEN